MKNKLYLYIFLNKYKKYITMSEGQEDEDQ
jgi:hypothetical protein